MLHPWFLIFLFVKISIKTEKENYYFHNGQMAGLYRVKFWEINKKNAVSRNPLTALSIS